MSKTHLNNENQIDGLLLFTSPLHAEIYCHRLHALGNAAWRPYCIEDRDIGSILARVQVSELRLWIVLGFSASETQQLLLDENQMFMTWCVAVEADVRRSAEGGEVSLTLPVEAITFLHSLVRNYWETLDADYEEQLSWMESWSDVEWEEHSTNALNKVATMAYVDYKRIWRCEQPNIALALFEPISQQWLFHGETASQLH